MAEQGDVVRVGGVVLRLDTACEWVRLYTDEEANRTSVHPYAYPAYDTFQASESGDPTRLTDADLLAPALLNVTPRIRSYYALQAIRPELEFALMNKDLALPLASITDPERIEAMVAPLYAPLSGPTKPWNVSATTLSKILHRKRPASVVLHDRWVRACYVGEDRPVPTATTRTWSEYMTAITIAIAEDLRAQPDAFEKLSAATGAPARLTPVRLLDILAWTSKGRSQSDADEH